MAGRAALALRLFLLVLPSLPVAVLSCGHHVVHSDMRSLVRVHQAQQSAHPLSGMWGAAVRQAAMGTHGSTLDAPTPRQDQNTTVSDTSGGDSPQHKHRHDLHSQHNSWPGAHAHDLEGGSVRASDARGDGAAAERRRAQQAAAPGPLRLSVTYQRLDALNGDQQLKLKQLVEGVQRVLQKFIMVKHPVSGGLLVDPYCLETDGWRCTRLFPNFANPGSDPDADGLTCGNATILSEHITDPDTCTSWPFLESLSADHTGPAALGGGVTGYGSGCTSYNGTQGGAVDLYLYVTAVNTTRCTNTSTVAWAQPCLLDLGSNRPLLGTINVCPKAFEGLDEDVLPALVTHEVIHALGLSDSLFGATRRPDGSARPLDETTVTRLVDGRNVTWLITPGVRDAAQAHFGCPSLEGAQLEEEGDEGSANTHWEFSLFKGEVMIAAMETVDGAPLVLSNLTLAYLEDTGWYVANRSAAGRLSWAAAAGCDLPASGSCRRYMGDVPGQGLFCDLSDETTTGNDQCTSDFKATGRCENLTFSSGCGMVAANRLQTCTGQSAPRLFPEVFGWGTGSPSGRCLPFLWQLEAARGDSVYYVGGSDGRPDAACFDTSCSADGSQVYVSMFGQQLDCPTGQYLNLSQLLPEHYRRGRMGPCPPAQELCATQRCPADGCDPQGGDCYNGACICRLSYTGANCSQNLLMYPVPAITNITGNNSGNSSAPPQPSPPRPPPPPPPPPRAALPRAVLLSLSLTNNRDDVAGRKFTVAALVAIWAKLDPRRVWVSSVEFADVGDRSACVVVLHMSLDNGNQALALLARLRSKPDLVSLRAALQPQEFYLGPGGVAVDLQVSTGESQPEEGDGGSSKHKNTGMAIGIVVAIAVVVAGSLIGIAAFMSRRARKARAQQPPSQQQQQQQPQGVSMVDVGKPEQPSGTQHAAALAQTAPEGSAVGAGGPQTAEATAFSYYSASAGMPAPLYSGQQIGTSI